MGQIKDRLSILIKKYKYAALIVFVGILLMLLPGQKNKQEETSVSPNPEIQTQDLGQDLEDMLSVIDGAGKVRVMLTMSKGEQTYFQYDSDSALDDGSSSTKLNTVIITDSSKNEYGMITRIDPPQYLGAVVICQGADSATIRLAIIDAVSKATGLGTDKICVLKMK